MTATTRCARCGRDLVRPDALGWSCYAARQWIRQFGATSQSLLADLRVADALEAAEQAFACAAGTCRLPGVEERQP